MNSLRNIVLSLCLCLPAAAQTMPTRISLVVVQGEGVTTPARQRVATPLIVRVEDDDHRPIPGAAVMFALPVSGASGEFIDGGKNLSIVTDQEGLATVPGLKANDVPGKIQIYVTGSYRGLRARTLITQNIEAVPGGKETATNFRPATHGGGKWKWIVLGVAAAGGAGAGIYYAAGHGGSSAPTSISAGPVVFGSPR
jgi:hypothetical protein